MAPLIVVDKVSRVDALKYSKLIYPTLIISENSSVFLIWQAVLLLAIIYDILINSFEIAFLKSRIEHSTIQKLMQLVSWLYLVDMVVRSNLTFVNNKSEEICSRKSIFENYRRSLGFYFDLVATLPIEMLLLKSSYLSQSLFRRFFPVHRLFKLYRLGETYRNIEKRSVHKLSFMIVRVIFQLGFQLHIIACLWYSVVLYAYDKDRESPYIWLPPQLRMTDIGDEKGKAYYYESPDLFYKYTQTFYSVLAQMSGNDINVSDELQVVLSIIIGLLGSVNLGIIFGNVMLVYQKLSSTTNEYLSKLNQFREDVEEHDIPDDSKIAGLKYLEFCYNIKKYGRFTQVRREEGRLFDAQP